MEEDTRRMICDRCRKAVPIKDIRYLPKGKDARIALCSECRSKGFVSDEKEKKVTDKKLKYFCSRCRYKFKFDPTGVSNIKCPYCGKDDKIIEDKVPPADELLKSNLDF